MTGTENAMMLAAGLPGRTIIKIAAAEPHVEDLGNFLIKMGAKIKGLGTHTLEITGTRKLRGAKHDIIPDPVKAAHLSHSGGRNQKPHQSQKHKGGSFGSGLGKTQRIRRRF